MSAPGLLGSIWMIVQKDARLEWRSRTRVNATLFFSFMALLMFSFAVGPDAEMLSRHAPGFLWLAIFLASVLMLSVSLRIES
jgi:heme exporter protein B